MKVLEKVNSDINGEITVTKAFPWGTFISVGGITQSGGILTSIWKQTLQKVKKDRKFSPKRILILGLGGGSLVQICKKYYPKSYVTGVDIDAKMVDLGKKYLGLDDNSLKIIFEDATSFIKETIKSKEKYDLILVDIYLGGKYPEKFRKGTFLSDLGKVLSENGYCVLNHLYSSDLDVRKEARTFGETLEKYFEEVTYYYPQANLMFICRS